MKNFESNADRIVSAISETAVSEGERISKTVADTVSEAAAAATEKLNAGLDYVATSGQAIKKGIEDIAQTGWPRTKEKTIAFARREPFTALAIALSAGVLLGWLTTRKNH